MQKISIVVLHAFIIVMHLWETSHYLNKVIRKWINIQMAAATLYFSLAIIVLFERQCSVIWKIQEFIFVGLSQTMRKYRTKYVNKNSELKIHSEVVDLWKLDVHSCRMQTTREATIHTRASFLSKSSALVWRRYSRQNFQSSIFDMTLYILTLQCILILEWKIKCNKCVTKVMSDENYYNITWYFSFCQVHVERYYWKITKCIPLRSRAIDRHYHRYSMSDNTCLFTCK